jgi:predicted  nucleic acid-binding Zn-ribbon protein
MNTGMDIVDKLVKRVSLLEEKILSMQKELKAAEAKASSASNGVNTVQKAVDAIARRVTSLESKK